MLYSKYLTSSGWTEEHILLLEKLLWTHAIKAEEFYGFSVCTENLEYSVHFPADIRRHSSPDNYSCDMFERSIKRLKEQRHNSKGIEKTYCERESIRLFLNDYELVHGPLFSIKIEKHNYRFSLTDNVDGQCFLNERSYEAAEKLLWDLKAISQSNPNIQRLIETGVLLGKLKRKVFGISEFADIERRFQEILGTREKIRRLGKAVNSIAKFNSNGRIQKFTKGCKCILKGGADLSEEWCIEVKQFFLVGPVRNQFYVFVDGDYYVPAIDRSNNNAVIHHPWTETPELVFRNYTRGRLQLSNQLSRVIILYPEPSSPEHPSFYLAIDFDQSPQLRDITVPVYPIVGDILAIRGPANVTWFGKVQDVTYKTSRLEVKWFDERPTGILRALDQYDQVHFRSVLRVVSVKRVSQGYAIMS